MRTITLALPDDVMSISAYYKMTDGAIHQVEVLSSGAVVDDLIPVKRSIDSRYVEGLEKRIDALEAGLGKVYESLENNYNELDTAIDAVRIDAEAFKSLPKSTGEVDATANRGVYTDILRRLKELEERAKVSRPTWDNFSLHDQRICKLESRMEDAEKKAAVAESVRKQLAEDIKATNGRIQNLEEKTGQTRDRLYAY